STSFARARAPLYTSEAPMAGTLTQSGRVVARAMSATTSRASALGSSLAMMVGVATTPSISAAALAQRMSSIEVVARKMRIGRFRVSGGEVEFVGVRDLLETEALRRRRCRNRIVRVSHEEQRVCFARTASGCHVEH